MKAGRALRVRIRVAGALLITAFVGSAAYDVWRLHQQIVSANARELSNLSNALAEEASRNLQAVDLLLRDTATLYEAETGGAIAGGDRAPMSAMLAMRAAGVSQVSVVTIIDAQGREVARSRDTGEPLANVADRPYFRVQREKSVAGLFVNEAIMAGAGRVPGMVLSRRITGPDGRFDGVVTATVTVAQLQAAYAAIHLGEGSALLLTSGDGTLVVRQPRIVGIEGKFRFDALPGIRKGAVLDRLVSPMDGRTKLVSAVVVGDRELILAVTRDEQQALQPWVDEMRSATIRTLLICALIVIAIVGLLRQLRREEALEARLQQARRLEALGTLAGGIAHDFNNILGAILGFGEMAQQRAEEGSALRRYVDQMVQSGLRARLLVKKILDFSRSGAAARGPVNVQGIVEEALAMLAPTLPAGLRVVARLDAGNAAVTADATELHQVVMNLCTNAVQASGDAGVVDVALARRALAQPRAFTQGELRAGEFVSFEVSDTGSGIDASALARIFDPFFTTKKQGEGTGLGLSVVHGIVSDLHGAIDIASREGHGTTVSVWLPVVGELARAPARAEPSWATGHGETVMIVDDERALVELAEELLAALGYEPVGFDSSEAAWAAFEADPARFDLVLTDETLPGLRGTELAARMRALRAVPVVLVSGNLGDAAQQAAHDAGVAAVLHKPLALRELAQCLAQVVREAPGADLEP